MKIEIISGSPRVHSVTHRVALFLEKKLKAETDHEIGLIALKDHEIPPVQSVWVSPEKAPEHLRPLATRVFEADAFILVTPEYNGSYSPTLKNFIDHFPKQVHKAFGLVTASPGAMGGMRATQQLLLLVPGMFGIASPYMLVVPAVDKKFGENGELLDESFTNAINTFTTEFRWLAKSLIAEKVNA